MASILKISTEELRKARKGGFKKKKPKKPKSSASLTTFENWISRNNDFVKEAKQRAKDYEKKEKLKKQIRNA